MANHIQAWVERIRGGDVRSLARAISMIEDGRQESLELLKALFPLSGRAPPRHHDRLGGNDRLADARGEVGRRPQLSPLHPRRRSADQAAALHRNAAIAARHRGAGAYRHAGSAAAFAKTRRWCSRSPRDARGEGGAGAAGAALTRSVL